MFMKRILKNIGFIIGLFSLFFMASCEDKIDPVVESLEFDRAFSPIGIEVKIRNKTTAEFNLTVRDDASYYVIELSEDNLQFNTIVKTANVKPEELPYSMLLDGETTYSARVKAVSNSGASDSKWVTGIFSTEAENIFAAVAGDDIKATSVTLKWPAASDVTHFIITPGNTERTITVPEKAAGQATITGLTGETEYTVKMMKGTKQRGLVTFKTLIDIGDATAVHPEDDLNAMVAAAADGAVLVLFPGEYLAYTGKITLNKSISIKGLYPHNKPLIHIQFVLETGVQAFEIRDVEMDGLFIDPATTLETKLDHAFQYNTAGTDYGSLKVNGCTIHDYLKSLFSASSIAATVAGISMDNSVVTNVLTDGADCIDFRTSYLASLSLKNSTFNNCAPARDFIRLDDASGTYPGKVSAVLIDHCTLFGVSNSTSRRILYVRFKTNTLTVTNSIIAGTAGYYTNQSTSAQPECSKNNYFNAPGFITGGSTVSGAKFDISGTHTLLDPGFVNAASGNFKITNQTLIDNAIGDPRWRQ
ncbi:MAG: hypothetical protein A2W90_03415 [Bacteroidetes bacterium GWF2_42_66]|nr:MAG: hypothetical protein A2W92_18330 [Bacteroidetes bacterium GWA2_42_15]OFY02650.1 MAG: hypothetical protein A2W89_22435 [Bacteroidetes bacterium GWE2_42_39]OFY41459.1 MAG: hypothetical protein A2W90_03415 [Bacteroidetes bacterium GWF2_42_66]